MSSWTPVDRVLGPNMMALVNVKACDWQEEAAAPDYRIEDRTHRSGGHFPLPGLLQPLVCRQTGSSLVQLLWSAWTLS